MKYVRYDAPPELRLRYHFRDKFGNDIIGCREYDPETGIGKCIEPGTNPDDNILREFFRPQGYVEIDGHTNPSKETLDALFNNTSVALNKQLQDKLVNRIEQEVTFRKGQAEVSSS